MKIGFLGLKVPVVIEALRGVTVPAHRWNTTYFTSSPTTVYAANFKDRGVAQPG